MQDWMDNDDPYVKGLIIDTLSEIPGVEPSEIKELVDKKQVYYSNNTVGKELLQELYENHFLTELLQLLIQDDDIDGAVEEFDEEMSYLEDYSGDEVIGTFIFMDIPEKLYSALSAWRQKQPYRRDRTMTRPLSEKLKYKTLNDIAPKAFMTARQNIAREEQEVLELMGFRKGKLKKRLLELGLNEGRDLDRFMEQEKRLMEEMGINSLYDAYLQASEAYHDIVRFIGEWKCHILILTGWSRNLYEQREITFEDINSMILGVEDYETGQVTLEDGRLFRPVQGDRGYYYGDDGSVISALDLVRTDKNGIPCKVEIRLGYVPVGGSGTYDAMPY